MCLCVCLYHKLIVQALKPKAERAKTMLVDVIAKLTKPATIHLEVGVPPRQVIFGLSLKENSTLNWKVLQLGQPLNEEHQKWRKLLQPSFVKRPLEEIIPSMMKSQPELCFRLCLGVAAVLDAQLLAQAAASQIVTDYVEAGLVPLAGPRKRKRLDPELRKTLEDATRCGKKNLPLLQKLGVHLFRGRYKQDIHSNKSLVIRSLMYATQKSSMDWRIVAASDAGTIGGQKTLFTCIYNHAANISTWLPPQVSCYPFLGGGSF